ncbi:MAG: hypothetical protein LBT46_05790 [Planctomycetaceae bacterium]|jgi:hypothetical protein|nr:hypothetical protein [Planctomycetaceae bacterium]
MPNVAVSNAAESNVAESNAAEKLPETILEKHISRTCQGVKQTDLLTSFFVLLSSLLVLTMIAVLADHWMLTDGLNVLQRSGVLLGFLAVIVFFICRIIIPVLRRSVNPLYAADLIEQTAPSLKNSLINWLLLRKERSEQPNPLPLAERMFNSIAQAAAAKVSVMPAERGLGSRSIFWSGIAAAVLMSTFIAYLSFSPKNPMQTLSRIMLPFADIERPQAVEFRNIKPGNTVMLQGERLTVSAEVFGHLNDNVYLVFSTKDAQALNQRVPMAFDKDALRYEADFPPGKQGFISDTQYFLEQGNNRSRTFNITVRPTASIEVTSVKYKYPLYTGLEEKTVTEHGDIRAVEGTEAAVSIHSSLPLDEIKLVFDNQLEERMNIAADKADDASVRLELKRNQTQKTYSLSAKDTNGYDSRRSGIFQYEVLPDLPPKVQWSDTAEHLKGAAQLELPEDAALELSVQAEDPDFALRYLRFKIESGDKNIKPVDLIESPSSGPTQHKGQITKTHQFIPKESRLAAGDTADIWVEATDTKFPGGNTAETVHIKITVTKSNKHEEKQDNKKEDKQDSGKKDEKQKDEEKQEQKQNKEQEKGQRQEKKNEQQQGGETEQEKSKDSEAQQGGNTPKQDGEKQDGGKSGNAGKEKSDKKGEEQTGNQAGGGDKPSLDNADDNAENNADGNAGGQEKQDGNKSNDNEQNGNQDTKEKGDSEDEDGEPNTGEQNNKSNDNNGGSQKNSSPNPDTQDGDAMEKIAEQMKQEGKAGKKKQEERQRNDNLDADSADTEKKGGDSGNPKKRNKEAETDRTQNEKHNHGENGSDTSKSEEGKSGVQQSGQDNSEPGKPEQNGGQPQQEGQQGGKNGDDQTADNQGNNNAENKSNKKEGQKEQAAKEASNNASKDASPQGQKNGQKPSSSRASANSEEPGTNQSQDAPSGGFGTNAFEQQTAKEEANLEYADKVTNMVLEYLEDQLKDKPDGELLQKLGWTEEQLRRFYEKWKTLSDGREAEKSKRSASQDYLEALKSLGLVPDKTDRGLQDNHTKTKDKEHFTESQRFAPPDALKEKFKIYSEGIGK